MSRRQKLPCAYHPKTKHIPVAGSACMVITSQNSPSGMRNLNMARSMPRLLSPCQPSLPHPQLAVQVLSEYEKLHRLTEIINTKPPGTRVIIFCSTKRTCDQLAGQLRSFRASAIHGDKRQTVGCFALLSLTLGLRSGLFEPSMLGSNVQLSYTP